MTPAEICEKLRKHAEICRHYKELTSAELLNDAAALTPHAPAATKWCEYCKVDTHNDAECGSTRPGNWKPYPAATNAAPTEPAAGHGVSSGPTEADHNVSALAPSAARRLPDDAERISRLISEMQSVLKAPNYGDKRVLLGFGDITALLRVLQRASLTTERAAGSGGQEDAP